MNPNLARAYANRGWVYKSRGECARAIPDFTHALKLEDGTAAVYTFRASCYLEENKQEAALKDLERAVTIDSSDPKALLQLGLLKEKFGDYDAAVKVFSTLVSSQPNDPNARLNLGVALGKKGRFLDSIRELTECLRLDPQNREALLDRAIAYEFLGDSKNSRTDFTAALRLPENKQTSLSLRPPVSTVHVKEMMTAR